MHFRLFYRRISPMLTINFEKRDNTQKLEALRTAGKLPAVFYGRKEKTTSITVPAAEFLKVWKNAGESSVIELKGLGEEHQALIKDIDKDPVTDVMRHADFYVIEKGKKLKVKVPIEFGGVSPAVKELGGILVKVLHTLEIEALPKDLPQRVHVDISPLVAFDSQIHASDIKIPENVTLIQDLGDIVASIAQPVEEKEEVVVAPDLSAIEVEKKGKKEEEGAEGTAPAAGAAGTAPAGKGDKKAPEKK